jgi:hypothetical protein
MNRLRKKPGKQSHSKWPEKLLRNKTNKGSERPVL